MTPLRISARRAGLIEKTVPQIIEEALTERFGVGRHARSGPHHALDHLLHLGYGATAGTIFRLSTRRRSMGVVPSGLSLGVLAWLVGGLVVIPLLDAARPLWRTRMRENVVNLLAHLVFGWTTALLADDFSRQERHHPTSGMKRWHTTVG